MQALRLLVWQRLTYWIERLIILIFPFIMRRSLNKGLCALWQRGDWQKLSKTGVIFAANHPSWWDMYVLWFMGQKIKRNLYGMMREDTLKTFPFFRSIGVIGVSEVRESLRLLQRDAILQIFPQGEMHQGGLTEPSEGVAFLAEKSKAPVYPLALRFVVRGGQQAEAFLVLGEPLFFSGTRAEFLERLKQEMNCLLESVDNLILETHPEAEPEGFTNWLPERKRFDKRITWLQKLWQR
ncbi:MAG: lysophospholipid acyltransferase family protein [Trueperaceae bacterium]